VNVVKRDLPAAVRALLVRQLGAAIAQEYRRQHPVHAERPARLEHVAGRVVHEGEILNVNYLSQPEEQHPNAGASSRRRRRIEKREGAA